MGARFEVEYRMMNWCSSALTACATILFLPMAANAADTTATDTLVRPGSVELRDGTGARIGVPGSPLSMVPSSTASASAALPPGVTAGVTAGTLVLKPTAGNLYDVYAVSAAPGALVLIDAATAPSAGAITPVDCFPIQGNYAGLSYPTMPESFINGIVALISTGTFPGSCTTYTPGSGFIHGRVK